MTYKNKGKKTDATGTTDGQQAQTKDRMQKQVSDVSSGSIKSKNRFSNLAS